jgi:hypothetical protein
MRGSCKSSGVGLPVPKLGCLLGKPQKLLSQHGLHLMKISLLPHSLPTLVQIYSLLPLIMAFEGLKVVAFPTQALPHSKLHIFGATVSLSFAVL